MKFKAVIAVLLAAGLLALVMISKSLERSSEAMSRELRTALDNQSGVSLVINELGYTGFIHNFKNYVLRGDEAYYQAASADLRRLNGLFANYRHLQQDRSAAMQAQMHIIERTIGEYAVNLELARRLHSQNLPVSVIDQRVRVDDLRASQALRNLIAQHQLQAVELLRSQEIRQRQVRRLFDLALLLGLLLIALLAVYNWGLRRDFQRQRQRQQTIEAHQPLLDAIPSPTLVVAESGQVVVANDEAGKLLQSPADEVVGQPVETFLPALVRPEGGRLRHLFAGTDTGEEINSAVTLATAQGRYRRVEVNLGLYPLNEERYAVLNLEDVSRVENIQRHVAEMEQTFRSIFELAPVGIAQLSLEGNFIAVNQHFATMFGYRRRELEGRSINIISQPEERDANRIALHRLLSDNRDHVRIEKRFVDRKGNDVWGIQTLSLYRGEVDSPDYVIAIFEDISYRKEFEQELLASEAKFKSIANHVNGVVWMATPGIEKMLFINNRFEEIWGRSIASVMQHPKSFLEAILPEDRERVEAEIERHKQGVWFVNYRIRARDGSIRYIHDEGTPVRGMSGELLCVVGLARDVTAEHEARERLKQTNRQLEQLAKFDPLTMAVRRPYSTSDLNESIALHKRYQTPATLIFIDLNDFKEVNDTHGHEAGDQVLAEFAKCVRSNTRETDSFYRYAGDEFLLLLRETDHREAQRFLRKLEQALRAIELPDYRNVSVTISYGAVALGGEAINEAGDWVKLADERMYRHKKEHKRQRL
ncbi:MAG: PAS domain S-box protein [Pseudomonadota bacterium]|nr:hypothetical protein [Pseudomonadales bacterium]MDY6919439.1 PAS domain S-box protein [Pseudomonadota bacterium]